MVTQRAGHGLPAIGPRVEGGGSSWFEVQHTGKEFAPLQGGGLLLGSPIGMGQTGALGPTAQEDGPSHSAAAVEQDELSRRRASPLQYGVQEGQFGLAIPEHRLVSSDEIRHAQISITSACLTLSAVRATGKSAPGAVGPYPPTPRARKSARTRVAGSRWRV